MFYVSNSQPPRANEASPGLNLSYQTSRGGALYLISFNWLSDTSGQPFFLFANELLHDIIRIDRIVQKRISEFSQLQQSPERSGFFYAIVIQV